MRRLLRENAPSLLWDRCPGVWGWVAFSCVFVWVRNAHLLLQQLFRFTPQAGDKGSVFSASRQRLVLSLFYFSHSDWWAKRWDKSSWRWLRHAQRPSAAAAAITRPSRPYIRLRQEGAPGLHSCTDLQAPVLTSDHVGSVCWHMTGYAAWPLRSTNDLQLVHPPQVQLLSLSLEHSPQGLTASLSPARGRLERDLFCPLQPRQCSAIIHSSLPDA